MHKIVLAVTWLWAGSVLGMDVNKQALTYNNYPANLSHQDWHAQDLAFIQSSNNPLTAATAVGSCFECMRCAIAEYKSDCKCCSHGFKFWNWSKPSEDLMQATWNAAIHKHNFAQLRLLLDKFPEAVHVTKIGRPILFHAVCMNNFKVAQELVDHGADVNEMSNGEVVFTGHTPLMVAVHKSIERNNQCHKEMIKLLVDHGADVNAVRTQAADTSLLLAHDKETISFLIDHGAYIDDCDKKGRTVFHAIRYGAGDGKTAYIPQKGLSDRIKPISDQSKELLKKILVTGALRLSPSVCCGKKNMVLKKRIEYELVLQRVMKCFERAQIPREVRVHILSFLPSCIREFSASMLELRGDLITHEQCTSAVQYIPESVLARVAQRLPVHKKSIFAQRVIDALRKRRSSVLWDLTRRLIGCDNVRMHQYITLQIPEYWVPSEFHWPPPQLEQDIWEHYQKMFGMG